MQCHLVVINVTTSDLTLSCAASLLGRSALLTTGDLENFKKSPFTLKEGVEYRIQITFKVKELARCQTPDFLPWLLGGNLQTLLTVLIHRSTKRSCRA